MVNFDVTKLTFGLVGVFFGFLGVLQYYFLYSITGPLYFNDIKKGESYVPELIIGIPSARNNFRERASVRNSWGGEIQKIKEISYKFFIGAPCLIPVLDRIDEHDCIEAPESVLTGPSEEIKFHEKLSCSEETGREPAYYGEPNDCYVGFGFQALQEVLLFSVGINVALLEKKANVIVTIRDPEEIFENLYVSLGLCFVVQNDYCHVPIAKPLILPKYFEGEITVTSKEVVKSSKKCSFGRNELLRFTFGRTYIGRRQLGYEKYNNKKCTHVIGNFSLRDGAALVTQLKGKRQRKAHWSEEQEKIASQLSLEIQSHNDIVILPDVVDVYRNLPRKILEMLKWSNMHHSKVPVLKMDDDTFLNVSLFMQTSKSKWLHEGRLVMWSQIIAHRDIPRFGKWADVEFNGMAYPPFPSGSGYLLSGPLVSLISEASHFLRPFQGEDISIGIWTDTLQLGGENIQKIDVDCWLLSEDDDCPYAYFVPDLTAEQMLELAKLLGSDT